MTLVQTVRRTATIVGFPPSAWAFALRIWAAMMLGLYAAFWLQLETASSAAVTVGILALQTRGQAYQKAVYRVLATIIGVVASFVIAGLFPQNCELFMVGFAGWLGLCVYVCGLLDGNRAYGAVLAGYTVALVAVTQIDLPQNIFLAGVSRGAAIVVGIAALALVSDVFAAPNAHTGLYCKLVAGHRRVRAFALAILRGESADPIQSADLLREITVLRPDITALESELSDGRARGAAARNAAVALVAEVSAARALASLPASTSPSLRQALGEALADGPREESRALQLRLQRRADVAYADPHDALFARHAWRLLIENWRARDAIEDLQAGRDPARRIHAPIYRSRRAAVRDGLRAFLVVLISGVLFSLGGWPFASLGVAMVGVLIALERDRPEPARLRGRRRDRHADRRAACGRDGVPDPRRRRPVSPSGDRNGAKRPYRRLAVHDPQPETSAGRILWCSCSSQCCSRRRTRRTMALWPWAVRRTSSLRYPGEEPGAVVEFARIAVVARETQSARDPNLVADSEVICTDDCDSHESRRRR